MPRGRQRRLTRSTYRRSTSAAAKLAAQQYLIKADKKLVAFSSAHRPDGGVVITVKAKAHADTRAFKLLRYVGLKEWVNRMTNPTGTGTAD